MLLGITAGSTGIFLGFLKILNKCQDHKKDFMNPCRTKVVYVWEVVYDSHVNRCDC